MVADAQAGAVVGLTLVTVTMPSRADMLAEMLATVAHQTVKPEAHLIVWDHGAGFVDTCNKAVRLVESEWFCFVDDDDLLDPHHVATLTENLTADIVWTWTRVEGRDWSPNSNYAPGRLASENYIPSNCAFRTELWLALGGYQADRHPDWGMLRRAEASGATFLNIPEVTWMYRFHGGNTSQ